MARVAADPVVRFWWSHCEPCQRPARWAGPPPSQGGDGAAADVGAPPGDWWASLKLVGHCGAWATAWSATWPDPDFCANHPRGLTTTKVHMYVRLGWGIRFEKRRSCG